MLNQNGKMEGCKKPNGDTLASNSVQTLAVGTNEKLPESKYRTETAENKPGITSC
ncbi:hypothetical protein [Xenorhabdus szentirmaii]|uniref:Uncharacterized protein n=1 Tax=Xenorhabdus szentirmaii TaxID=290112 RepID=A0AAW3YMF2_9GAMM|nr:MULTISPECIES: hypothetical protein [Xenorhabdus]MBD2782308.1 hypothetical protein [Xenorhabdus sp. 38]MBD2799220.1 hypothetical protein [Xenorhabdus sp. M]PHM40515.1 hypothetical protein Xszus_00175 [Xenorhabdus szentirmaii]